MCAVEVRVRSRAMCAVHLPRVWAACNCILDPPLTSWVTVATSPDRSVYFYSDNINTDSQRWLWRRIGSRKALSLVHSTHGRCLGNVSCGHILISALGTQRRDRLHFCPGSYRVQEEQKKVWGKVLNWVCIVEGTHSASYWMMPSPLWASVLASRKCR